MSQRRGTNLRRSEKAVLSAALDWYYSTFGAQLATDREAWTQRVARSASHLWDACKTFSEHSNATASHSKEGIQTDPVTGRP